MKNMKFSRGEDNDKLQNLGIGKLAAIKQWLEDMSIRHYVINDDLTIDVNQQVCLDSKVNGHLPDYIQFGVVNSAFLIRSCKLTTLKGCPTSCSSFYCSYNNLTSLEYSPVTCSVTFSCEWNLLKSLEYLHRNITARIYAVDGNDIDPKEIGKLRSRGLFIQ